MSTTSLISVACFDRDVWIRIEGRGNFEGSVGMKEYVMTMIEKGYYEYVIDLMDCDQMDSTFMGTIAGIAQSLRKEGKGTLKVVNVSEHNQELMENLGLDQLLLIQPLSLGNKIPPTVDDHCFCVEPIFLQENAKTLRRDVLISAHQSLVLANRANAKKFQDLFEYIK